MTSRTALLLSVLVLAAAVAVCVRAQLSPGGDVYDRTNRILRSRWVSSVRLARPGRNHIDFTPEIASKFLQLQEPHRFVRSNSYTLGPAHPANLKPVFGSAGGDLSLFVAVYSAYLKLAGKTSPDAVEVVQGALEKHINFAQMAGGFERKLTMFVDGPAILHLARNVSMLPPAFANETILDMLMLAPIAMRVIEFANTFNQTRLLTTMSSMPYLIPCHHLRYLTIPAVETELGLVPGTASVVAQAFFKLLWQQRADPTSNVDPNTMMFTLGSPTRLFMEMTESAGQNFFVPDPHGVLFVTSDAPVRRDLFDPDDSNVLLPLLAGDSLSSDIEALVVHFPAIHSHRMQLVNQFKSLFAAAVDVSALAAASETLSVKLINGWVDFLCPNCTAYDVMYRPIEQPESLLPECPELHVRVRMARPARVPRFEEGDLIDFAHTFMRSQMPIPFSQAGARHLASSDPLNGGPVRSGLGGGPMSENNNLATEPVMASPGGDLLAWIRAMDVYNRLHTPALTSSDDVATLLERHLNFSVARALDGFSAANYDTVRRFYMQTSEDAMMNLTFAMHQAGCDPQGFFMGPYVPLHDAFFAYGFFGTNHTCADIFMAKVVEPAHIGDYHIRSMLEHSDDFGIDKKIIQWSIQGTLKAMWKLMLPVNGTRPSYQARLLGTTINVGYAINSKSVVPAMVLRVYSNVTNGPCAGRNETNFTTPFHLDIRGNAVPLVLPTTYFGDQMLVMHSQAAYQRAAEYSWLIGGMNEQLNLQAATMMMNLLATDMNMTLTFMSDFLGMAIFDVVLSDFPRDELPTISSHILTHCSSDPSSYTINSIAPRPSRIPPGPHYVNHSFTMDQARGFMNAQFRADGGHLEFVEPSAFPLTCQQCANNSEPVLSSLGGDLAEFILAIHAYVVSGGSAVMSEEDVYDLLEAYLLPRTWHDTIDEVMDELDVDVMAPRNQRNGRSGQLAKLLVRRFGDRPLVLYVDQKALEYVHMKLGCDVTKKQCPSIMDPHFWTGRFSFLGNLLKYYMADPDAFDDMGSPVIGLDMLTRDFHVSPVLVSSVIKAMIQYTWDRFNATLSVERHRVHIRPIQTRRDVYWNQDVPRWQLRPHAVFFINNMKSFGACSRRRAAPLFVPRTDPTEVIVVDTTPQLFHWAQLAEFFAQMPYVSEANSLSSRGFLEVLDSMNQRAVDSIRFRLAGEVSTFNVDIVDKSVSGDNKDKIITGLSVAVGIISGVLGLAAAYLWWLKCKPRPKGTKTPLPLLTQN